ncbi:FYN-binding protein 1-like [Epinephelus moara]|uniref:FYN-binding protein 1-like n=1 Tax=Epinephelus moara TaxID=300413 RepID=UPI00214F4A2B|nr:FYN-binding protein 1-like [Epinephelus moara]
MDESYENVGIKKPPPLPLQEHPSKRTQVDLSDDRMEQAEKSKKHQKSKRGKDDANHGKVTKKKEAEPKGTINPKEIKGHERKAKKEKKEKKKKFKIKGPIHIIEKGKAKSDLSLNQAEIIEVVQNTDVSVMTEAVTTGLDDLNVNEETEPWMYWSEADVYDDIGVLDEVCR